LPVAKFSDGIFHRFAHGIKVAAECFNAPCGEIGALLAYACVREGWGLCITPESAFLPMPEEGLLCCFIRRRLLDLCPPTTPKMYYFVTFRPIDLVRKSFA
jgi:hypothetical protein